MNNMVEHLKMIQAVIDRLARTSSQIKGWSLTVTTALLTLAAQTSDARVAYMAVPAVIAFWGLDGYFLHQERLYRKLYNLARTGNDDNQFCMDAAAAAQHDKSETFMNAMRSKPVAGFYGFMIAWAVIVAQTMC